MLIIQDCQSLITEQTAVSLVTHSNDAIRKPKSKKKNKKIGERVFV